MGKPRSELSAVFHTICNNVYFQPPTGKMLTYPCIVYSLDAFDVTFADNGQYRLCDKYSVTYITRDPDDGNIRALAMLPLCSMTNTSHGDNIHHYYYKLFT